jgi:hypothetical protein
VVHLYSAYEIQPDDASRARLLDAIDARNSFITSLYDQRSNPVLSSGWAYTLFPYPGHNAAHLRLAHDGYQEPYAGTCLNWDTRVMRDTPAVGKRRTTVVPATAPVSLDAPQWRQVDACRLTPLPPHVQLPRATTLRLLYDESHLYILAECELEPDGPAEFPALPRDRSLSTLESLDVCLAPDPGEDVWFHFQVGVNAASRYDAAAGLVSEVMDPRFGQEDPAWNGDWRYESRWDAQTHRWQAMIAIPFAALDVPRPRGGITWRGNFARSHQLPRGQVDRSIWSANLSSVRVTDRSLFGDLVFVEEPAR